MSAILKHELSVDGAVFNKEETRILTWSDDGTARLWDAVDGSPIGQPMKHDKSVDGAVFNKDETRILTWSDDDTARLWDATDGSPIGQPMIHEQDVNGAVFNKDETRILTRSDDRTARLWDIEVDTDFPKSHLSLMVKVATGTSMDDYGNVITLSKNEWEEYKADYILIVEEHIKTCKHKDANIYLKYQKTVWGDN